MSIRMVAFVVAASALCAASAAAQPKGPALTEEILRADAEFFEVLFQKCEPERLLRLVEPDLEFYHDRGGLTASAKAFVDGYAKGCAEMQKPGAWKVRRELVRSSVRVYPVPDFGAIEEGDHVFYERKEGEPERRSGVGRFVQVWKMTPGGWRLARVFSYAHVDAK